MSIETKSHPDDALTKPHLTNVDGKQYDVRRLEQAAEQLPIQEFDLSDPTVTNIVQGKYWETTTGASIGPGDLLDAYAACDRNWDTVEQQHPDWTVHVKKIQRVDYQTPILVYRGTVIDGIHRLTKALSENCSTIPIKVIETLPEDAEYTA